MRNDLSRGIWFLVVLTCLVTILILSCLLAGCESPEATCQRACQELDLDFYSHAPPIIVRGYVQTLGICECQDADGNLAKLW